MSILTDASILQFRVWTVNNEQAAVNTFYYGVEDVVGSPTSLGVLNAFELAIAADYKAIMSTLSNFQGAQGRDITLVPLPVMDVATTSAGTGTQTSGDAPRQSCGINTWYTTLAGSARRGRTFWPFPASVDLFEDGLPSSAYLTLLASLCTAILNFTTYASGGNSCTLRQGIHSRVPGVGLTYVSGFVVRSKFATQKKRGSYGRPNSSPI